MSDGETVRRGFKIIDQRTGARVTIGTYLTVEQAWAQITEWQDRHDRGGRPDITRDLLLNMVPAFEDGQG